ncbi:MAG: VPDSG-CTERM sorting domain-containing protein [Verrucomicrobia bacterium]|nr:VPDSG-CTERM sorting domain-containing protein [Verrucomicrobiota bacterium]
MKPPPRHLIALLCAAIAASLTICASAYAGFIVTLTQQGSNVVATGSGAIDVTGLTFATTGLQSGAIYPNFGQIAVGPIDSLADIYFGGTGPITFGSGSGALESSSMGDIVGIQGTIFAAYVSVPAGYVSGAPLVDSSTYDNATFASLGVTLGTYEWTWGTGANQNFTLQIGPAKVPDSGSTFALLSLGLAALLARSRLRCLN